MIVGLVLVAVFTFIAGFAFGGAGLLSERLRTWRILSDSITVIESASKYSGDGRLPAPLMLDSLYYARGSLRLSDRQLRHEQLPYDFTDTSQ